MDDSSVAIGRRYARNDELGTPFGITVDFACAALFLVFASLVLGLMRDHTALKNGTITVRERDTMLQLIGPVDVVIKTVVDLCEGQLAWADVLEARKELKAYDGKQDVET